MARPPSVFVSYSHADKAAARAIADRLTELGTRVWLDEQELRVGDSIVERVTRAIADVHFVVAIVSENSVSSHWCQKELALAISGGLNRAGVKVLPLRLGAVEMPASIADTYHLRVDPDDPGSVADRLAQDVRAHLHDQAAARPLTAVGSPSAKNEPAKSSARIETTHPLEHPPSPVQPIGQRLILEPPHGSHLAPPSGPDRFPEFRPCPPDAPTSEMSVHLITNRQFLVFLSERENAAWRRGSIGPGMADDNYLAQLSDDARRANYPVVLVSYWAASAYAEWVSNKTRRTVRLPYQSEWKRAARAGRPESLWLDEEITRERVVYRDTDGRLSRVDGTDPNPWGLVGIVGHVRELCVDDGHEEHSNEVRVWACGGSYHSPRKGLKALEQIGARECLADVGFRCVAGLASNGSVRVDA